MKDLSSSGKHKEGSKIEYHKKVSLENKTESKRRCRYKEAKEVSEESYGEEEIDGCREKSKRRRDKYHWDKHSDDSSDPKSRRKHGTSNREAVECMENKIESKRRRRCEEAKEVSEESYGEEEIDVRRVKSRRRRDKYHCDKHSDDLSDTKSRVKHGTSKREAIESMENKIESKRRRRYEEAKEVSEESYGEEEIDVRRVKSRRRLGKHHWDKHTDDSSDTKSRKQHSTSKRGNREYRK